MCAIPHEPVISTDTELSWMNCEHLEMTLSTQSLPLPLSLSLFLLPSPSLALLQHLRDQPDCGGGRTTHQREWEGTSDREVRLPTGILRLLLWGRFPDACRTRWGEGVLGLDERRTPWLLLAPSASSEESTGDNTFSSDIRQSSLSWSKCTLHQCAKYTRINPWDTWKPLPLPEMMTFWGKSSTLEPLTQLYFWNNYFAQQHLLL